MLRNAKEIIKYWVAPYPVIYYPVYRLFTFFFGASGNAIKNGVEIVIEGFPRSGNTFAVDAFRLAQGRDVLMANHLHAEAQILRGIKLKIPVIVLVRHPVDAITSLLYRNAGSARQYAKRYIRFYTRVLLVCEQVVLADFSQVVEDFGEVIHLVNKRFSTEFKLFVHTNDNLDTVYQQLERVGNFNEGRRPLHLRGPLSTGYKNDILIDINDPYVQEAVRLYENIKAIALKQFTAQPDQEVVSTVTGDDHRLWS